MTLLRLRTLTAAGFLAAVLLPQPALAAEPAAPPSDPIPQCLEAAGGAESFLDCLEPQASALEEAYGLRPGWIERLRAFLADHPDWRDRVRRIVDRLEDRRDRREDRRDRREDRRDRFEDRHDQRRDREDFFDRLEDRRDRRQDRRDKWEDRWERWKDRRGQS